MSDDDMELPSATYRKRREVKRQKAQPLFRESAAATSVRSRSRSRRVVLNPSAAVAVAVAVDDMGKLSALKHFALHNSVPSEPADALDMLLDVMEREESKASSLETRPTPAETTAPTATAETTAPTAETRATATKTPPPVPQVAVQKVPCYVPKKLEQMFGVSVKAAVRKVLNWYSDEEWKQHPCVLWGPCGVGKTLLCNLLAVKFQASFVTYEDELNIMDKIKGWMQSSSKRETGVLAFSDTPSHQSWLLLDDVDSLEGTCRKDVLALFKKGKKYPGPVFLTCNDVYDKSMASLRTLPLTIELQPHSVETLEMLVRTVNPNLPPVKVNQIADMACGDARRTIISTQLQQTNVKDSILYHSPFTAVEALLKNPELHSRALDGQEFMVQSLLYQNYPFVVQDANQNYSLPPERLTKAQFVVQLNDLRQLSRVADAWCEFDCFDKLYELPNYTKKYLTYNIPQLCRDTRPKRKSFTRLKLNVKQMNQCFPMKKVSLDWHCMSKQKY